MVDINRDFTRPLEGADDLLSRALLELREELRGYIETGADLVRDEAGEVVVEKTANTARAIEGEAVLLELIRDIEWHLRGSPWIGPAWLDEVIQHGAAWAGGAS